ncbi:gamma-2-syntrophin isoform X2 [Pangasianodon hypophthalmus]|uniref:gamma-2-syntrophin isoform X2 n=1 Tax=Pangasianodon hypophthalmus TaxID=310915 RepID=UPI0014811C9A|nr:gamma-2-syntrophin isoform X2 [Pangasianodon hypophthalmus]
MNAAGKHRADPLERPGSLWLPTWTKTGLALLYDEKTSNTYDIRLKLTKEILTIQKQDVVCIGGGAHHLNHRTVVLRRQATGGLGLSIKGGAEHKVPVVISKIFKDQVADQTGMLFIGDAVLQINGINVEKCTHEEVVHLLRTAGDEVTITVRYLREAPAFLKLPLGSPGPSSDQSSRASSPLFDSGLHLNGNLSNTAPSSPSSPSANEPKYEKRWLDAVSLPLSMARVSKHKAGSDKLRSNSFEVFALDGACTNVLQFCTAAESTDWLQAISTNINDLTQECIKTANKYYSPDEQIIHMGWVCEHLHRSDANQVQSYKFLALKGSSLYILRGPPAGASEWAQAEATFNLCEVLFKVHKLWIAEDCWIQPKLCVGLQQDCELRDSEGFSFSVLVGHGQSYCFSVELGTELALWEKAFQRAVFMEVQRTGELEFANLTAVLHCIHSFIAAKVASVDPLFVNNQSITRKYMYNS